MVIGIKKKTELGNLNLALFTLSNLHAVTTRYSLKKKSLFSYTLTHTQSYARI